MSLIIATSSTTLHMAVRFLHLLIISIFSYYFESAVDFYAILLIQPITNFAYNIML